MIASAELDSQVTNLGHTFTADGMSPEPQKASVIRDWAVPTDTESFKIYWDLHLITAVTLIIVANNAAPLHHAINK